MVGKKIWEKFEDYMSAAAFAEQGEAETARRLLRRRRTVLLVLIPGGEEQRSADYARSVCRRIEAELEILLVPGGDAQQRFLHQYRRQLEKEGIASRVVKASGCLKKKILEITARRADIQFVVVESPEYLDISCEKERGREKDGFMARLKCPLVVVSQAGSPA